jgi:energy-coupling factor transport system permease protein
VLAAWRYRPRDTWVHRLDPRVKILTLLLPVLVASQVEDVRLMVLVCCAAIAYYLSARIPWRDVWRLWLAFSIFVLFLVSVNSLLFSGGGQSHVPSRVLLSWPWIHLGGTFPFVHPGMYRLTAAVLLYVITQALRLYSIAAYAFTFPFVVDPADLGVAFNRLGLHYKIAFAMDMAFRYVPAMGRELQTTIDAQRVRGYELDQLRGGPVSKSIRLAPIVVPVVLNAILGAEDIIDAMDLRCFGIGKRTWLRQLAYQNLDRVALGTMVGVLLLSIAANLTGHLGTWFPPGWR